MGAEKGVRVGWGLRQASCGGFRIPLWQRVLAERLLGTPWVSPSAVPASCHPVLTSTFYGMRKDVPMPLTLEPGDMVPPVAEGALQM